MSISTEIARIQASRDAIRAALVELGLANSTDNLDALAEAVESIIDRGAVNVEIREGETYTIPQGYHNGTGTVAGISGGGNYTLQTKKVTPTKNQQAITSDEGYYGLSGVTVEPIPAAYQNVSSVTADAASVLVGKIFVASDGTVVTGTMTNNGAVNKTLSGTEITYTIPQGYHNGTGTVQIVLEAKEVTPTKSTQTVTPTTGKVLSKVTVAPIPAEYIDTSDADAAEEHILDGMTAYVEGEKVTGTMLNRGAVTGTLDATAGNQSYTVPSGYHNGSGKVTITLEEKSATPTKSSQTVTPTTGKVLSKVTVAPIPAAYQDVTPVDVATGEVLEGKKFVSSTGEVVTGSMPNKGALNARIDGLSKTSYTIPAGYHNGSGTVALTSDIEAALADI